MSDEEFFKKLVRYIRGRYPTEVQALLPAVGWGIHDEKLNWEILAIHNAQIYETVDGKIGIWSARTVAVEDTISSRLLEIDNVKDHHLRFDKTKQIHKELTNKDTREKHKAKFKVLIERLEWGDEIAKKITEGTGINVKHYIPEPSDDNAFFYTEFDPKGMSDEEKMNEIKRHFDAIDEAYAKFQEYDKRWFEEKFLKKWDSSTEKSSS
jgi:hypothetical protein